MYNLLIKLMIIVALAEIGLKIKDVMTCNSKECSQRIERASRNILNINWRPISVFPEDAERFSKH